MEGKRKPKKKTKTQGSRWSEDRTKVRLGCRPFGAGIKHYAEKKSIRFTPTTIYENVRKLRYFSETFENLKKAKMITTTDPRHMGPDEISAFFRWMIKDRALGTSTQGSYTKTLKSYLEFWGNTIIDQMAEDDEIIIKSADGDSEIRALTIDDVREIFATADTIDGYKGIMIRLLLALGFSTGCRPNELFGAEITDINVKAETFFVRHPKGEGSWGQREKVNLIRKDMLVKIERELNARKDHLKSVGVVSKFVFVNPKTGLPYTSGAMQRYKRLVEERSGVTFRIKDLRPTLLTLLVDEDLSLLGAASKQLRHARTNNTEKYYLKIDKRRAVRQALGDRWEKNSIE